MKNPFEHLPRPQDEQTSERPSPLPERHRPGLRAALVAALASGFAAVSDTPAEAAPPAKERDTYAQSVPKKEWEDVIKERHKIIDARKQGTKRKRLEKKHPFLTMQLDSTEHESQAELDKRREEAANEGTRYIENRRRMERQWHEIRDTIIAGTYAFSDEEPVEEVAVREKLQGTFMIMLKIEEVYPSAQKLTDTFFENPDIQTMTRIKDVNSRMAEFYSLPQELQERVIARLVAEAEKQGSEAPPPYPVFNRA